MNKELINEFTVRFPSRSANEGFARAAASSFIAQLDPTMDELYDIKTAVSEAVTNAIVHGYRDEVGTITMSVRLLPPSTVEIIIKDKGCGSDRSGMGFTIMESFMDKLSVRSSGGKGTTVRMQKHLSLRPALRAGK